MKELKNIFWDFFIWFKDFHLWTLARLYSYVVATFISILISLPLVWILYLMRWNPVEHIQSENFSWSNVGIDLFLLGAIWFIFWCSLIYLFFIKQKTALNIIEWDFDNKSYHLKLLWLIPLWAISLYYWDKHPWFSVVLLFIWMGTFALDIWDEIKTFHRFLVSVLLIVLPVLLILVTTFIIWTIVSKIPVIDLTFIPVVVVWALLSIYFLSRLLFSLLYLASDIIDWIYDSPLYYMKKSLKEVHIGRVLSYFKYFILLIIPALILWNILFFITTAIPLEYRFYSEIIAGIIWFLVIDWIIVLYNAAFFKNVILEDNF